MNNHLKPLEHSDLIWEEIDLHKISENINCLKKRLNNNTKFMAVVKANAYGHGAVEVAETAILNGAEYLGVARIEEAILLRDQGISLPILIFGYTHAHRAADLIMYDLIASVFSSEMAQQLSSTLNQSTHRLKVHYKIDTGMGRVGFPMAHKKDDALSLLVSDLLRIKKMKNIDLEGIYTHFAMADSNDKRYTEKQFNSFSACLRAIKEANIDIPLKHCANSAALIRFPETHLDMVRAGVAMYGLYPSKDITSDEIMLTPALSVKSRIIYLKTVHRNFKVSYGCTYKTDRESILATVPVGYADGYSRCFSSAGTMLVRGQRAPVVGRVCMDQLILDVTDIKGAALNDEVVIIGNQETETILADDLADTLGTINYEIVSGFLPRVPKRYFNKELACGRQLNNS